MFNPAQKREKKKEISKKQEASKTEQEKGENKKGFLIQEVVIRGLQTITFPSPLLLVRPSFESVCASTIFQPLL
jgi:hypothetical protein